MHNRSLPPPFLQVIALEVPPLPPHPISCHGQTSREEDQGVMFHLLHALTCLSLLLVLVHLLSFLLAKLFAFLLQGSTAKERYLQLINEEEDAETTTELLTTTNGSYQSVNEELAATIFSSWEEEGLFFLYSGSVANDPLLVHEEKGRHSYQQQHLFTIDENFVVTDESLHSSTSHAVHDDAILGLEDRCVDHVPATHVVEPSDLPELARDEHVAGVDFSNHEEEKKLLVEQREEKEKEEKEEVSKNEKLFSSIDHQPVHFDSKKFKLEERTFGASLTTSESTSKSSMEWRSSAIFRDSETDGPFSSSSRRSSSNWETYTLFRKYDEEMMFFDRMSAQKLTETDSFRALKLQPRSISQRIVHKLTAQKKKGANRDPYKELECAYVAQICLAWEALNWNYGNFRQKSSKAGTSNELSSCTTWMAEQFQQFRVLLQRFIENEPYERGRRPQVFARTRISSPKLLQVPEFRDASEVDEGKEEMISSAEFLPILEDAIRTFTDFLRADRENPFKALIKKKTSTVDPNLLHLLKKENKKIKMKLKELLRQRSCLRRKRLKGEQETEVRMGLIDMKIVSRVLRMSEISQEQLHWCEEKMCKVRVWEGEIQRDSSPLFFPVH